jgi:hypothetical protein
MKNDMVKLLLAKKKKCSVKNNVCKNCSLQHLERPNKKRKSEVLLFGGKRS